MNEIYKHIYILSLEYNELTRYFDRKIVVGKALCYWFDLDDKTCWPRPPPHWENK